MGPGRHSGELPLRGGGWSIWSRLKSGTAGLRRNGTACDPAQPKGGVRSFGGRAKAMINAVGPAALWAASTSPWHRRGHQGGVAAWRCCAFRRCRSSPRGDMALETRGCWLTLLNHQQTIALSRYRTLREPRVRRVIKRRQVNATRLITCGLVRYGQRPI